MATSTMRNEDKVFTRPDREEALEHAYSVYERALAIVLEGEVTYVARKMAEYDQVTADMIAEGYQAEEA